MTETPISNTSDNMSFTALRVEAGGGVTTASNLGVALNGGGPFSVDAWVKLDGLAAGAQILTQTGVFSLGLFGNRVSLTITGFPTVRSDPGVSTLNDFNWHFICVTFDGGTVRIYIDGLFNVMQGISLTGKLATSTSPFQMATGMQGFVSGVRVYDQVLDADSVLSNMYGAPASGVVAAFDFSQVPPADTGPMHLPATLLPDTRMVHATPALALLGSAFAYPIEDFSVNPGGHQVDPYTVALWVFPVTTDSLVQVLFCNADLDSDTGMALKLLYESAHAGFRVASVRGANVAMNKLYSAATVAPDRWTHIATSFDGINLSLYINGVLDSSAPFGPIPYVRNYGECFIGTGRESGVPSGETALHGYITRIEVWTRALQAAEVRQYMDAVPASTTDDLAALYDFSNFRTALPRNDVTYKAVGFAVGAALTCQLSPAKAELRSASLIAPATGNSPSDEELIARLLAQSDGAPSFGGSGFMVTHHLDGDERILLVRSARCGTYIGYRGRAEDIGDCTLWQIVLVFTIVAGVMDVLFGVSCRLNASATNIIRLGLNNPRVYALLIEPVITGALLFHFMLAMGASGILRPLLFELLKASSFWVVLRVIARAVAIFTGAGAAAVGVALIAAVAGVAYVVSKRPAACNPPVVFVTAIQFNYNPGAGAIAALAIRKNFTTEIPVPEWTLGKIQAADSLAAYSVADVAGRIITIQAQFSINTPAPITVQIKADGGGMLGGIDPVMISFVGGRSDPAYVTLSLPHHTVAAGGVRRNDITWTWSYRINGAGAWVPMGATRHRIYVLLRTPTRPWQSVPRQNNTQLPWTDVLDHACAWAAGQDTAPAAAAAITRQVNGALNLIYNDADAGASCYTAIQGAAEVFLCTSFLEQISGQPGGGNGPAVNCSDCASIVATFANAVGCDLTESLLWAPAELGFFLCNTICLIGSDVWAYPAPPLNGFSYHEVAWANGGADYVHPLYDACLRVDSSGDPWGKTLGEPVAVSPTGMQFTTMNLVGSAFPFPTPYNALTYRERLAQNEEEGIGACLPWMPFEDTQGGRRRVI